MQKNWSMKQNIRNNIKTTYNIKEENSILTLIIDSNSLLKNSLVNKLVNSYGEEYGGIINYYIRIANILKMRNFNFCYSFWDGNNSGQLRAYLYPDYKANRGKNYNSEPTSDYYKELDNYVKRVLAYSANKRRNKQIKEKKKVKETEDEIFQHQRDIICQINEDLFIRNIFSDAIDDVEGDDLIAYYVKNKKSNEKIVIISSDRDLTQLIKDDVCVYLVDLKKFVTPQNHKEIMGYTHENVVLKKIFTGDSSDNIKGIKGVGEKTFFELFPEAKEKKMSINEIIDLSKKMIEERKNNKKKPLQSTENIVNGITDGCQGDKIYEINKSIIDLSEPLLTEKAKELLDSYMYAPIDEEGRTYNHLYSIVTKYRLEQLYSENQFSTFFSPFNALIETEKKFAKNYEES